MRVNRTGEQIEVGITTSGDVRPTEVETLLRMALNKVRQISGSA